jgi:repressor LexA
MTAKELKKKELEALRYIRNAIVHDSRSPSVRDLRLALDYKSPRSAHLVLQSLIDKGLVKRKPNGNLQLRWDQIEQEDHARTVDIPLVGSVPCGAPLLAEENIEAYVPVSQSLARSGSKYFLLRAVGDSMDQKGIEDGDLLLIRQQSYADDGDIVLALVDDEATVKEFWKQKDVIVLKPRSSKRSHQPIILSSNFLIQGVVVATLPDIG